jgi:hypothetical protein
MLSVLSVRRPGHLPRGVFRPAEGQQVDGLPSGAHYAKVETVRLRTRAERPPAEQSLLQLGKMSPAGDGNRKVQVGGQSRLRHIENVGEQQIASRCPHEKIL